MYKVYHGLTPHYISENFVLRNEMDMSVHLRSTAAGRFVPPLPKKECMRYSGCLIWNSLPSNVKSVQTAETFHNRCLKWLVQLLAKYSNITNMITQSILFFLFLSVNYLEHELFFEQ